MVESPLLVERREGWTRLTLNRPDRLNAFTEELHRALQAALDDAAEDDACRAVLLTGAGRGFCAGQDLSAEPASPRRPISGRRWRPSINRSCAASGH